MATDQENKNVGVTVDYISTDNELLGKNIQVHYQDFHKPDIGDFIDMYAPEQIYLRTNYPKLSLEYYNESGQIVDYNNVDVIRELYQPFKDMIVFAIFPLGGLEKNDGLLDYIDTTRDKLLNYPSLSITPTGNFISSGIIADKLFVNNGLYATGSAEPLLSENKGIPFQNGERKDTKTVKIGSLEREITVYNWQVNKEQSSSFLTLTVNDFGKISEAHSENFTYVNGNIISNLGGLLSLNKNISGGISSSSSAQSSNSSLENGDIIRYYELDNYEKEHPDIGKEDNSEKNSDDSNSEEDNSNANNGLSFLIAVNFLPQTKGQCELKFGKNTFRLPTEGDPQICINNDKKWTSCKIDKDINNLPNLPKFLSSDGFKNVRTAIFYPVWNGIAVQPGISLAKPSGAFRQGEPTVYPIGTVAECPLRNPEYPTKSTYVYPQYIDWIKSGTHGIPKTGHIKLIPNNAEWDGKCSLSFTNTIGNFFYMPIFFVPHSKFRMFFSGVKVGQYMPEKDPDVDYSYIYKYSGETNSVIPNENGYPEYSYPVELAGENEDIDKGKLVYKHFYEGSVIYSYPDLSSNDKSDDKKVSFISERVQSFMVPPKVPAGISGDGENKFWREYNKTLFYLDFEIKNPDFSDDNTTIAEKGLPRKPVEILGVLLTHVREIINSPIKNENGVFTVEPQDSIDEFTDNQLFVHQLECSCPKPWIHYATSINITHNQDGSDGNIVLDKYSLMGQDIFPKQHFGGIRLILEDGNKNFVHPNSSEFSDGSTSYIFSGIAAETKHMDSFNSDTLDITLKGLQYKLEDIKLINAPFFDGDLLSDVLRWFSKYTGVAIDMSFAAKDARIPTSSNFAKPFLMLTGGTPAIDGIRQACESANHRFILQPDGVGYVYEMSKEFSLPLVCKPNYEKAVVLGEIPTESIMSIDVQPFFGNLYNVVITAALLGSNNTIESPDNVENVAEIKLNQRVSHMVTEPDLPWARVIAHSHKGYMDEKQLSDRHRIDRSMSKRYWVNGSVTIPGNANAWIYNQIKIFGQFFYITDISHSIDFTTKTFKTTLNISKYLEEEDAYE